MCCVCVEMRIRLSLVWAGVCDSPCSAVLGWLGVKEHVTVMLEHVTLTCSLTGKEVLCPLTLKAKGHFWSWSYDYMMKLLWSVARGNHRRWRHRRASDWSCDVGFNLALLSPDAVFRLEQSKFETNITQVTRQSNSLIIGKVVSLGMHRGVENGIFVSEKRLTVHTLQLMEQSE